jgi:cyclopropane fatty-acyl-phospholipid synthase-like methyltransferase
MAIRLDPEGNEIKALSACAGSFAGSAVLEIGCGDGRLTRRYAAEAAHVTAIDPNSEKIARAAASLPGELNHQVDFLAYDVEEFDQRFSPAPSGKLFDRAIMAWSL